MKTNTIQIIRILCLRPALMPSRDSPAGIGAEPEPSPGRRDRLRQRQFWPRNVFQAPSSPPALPRPLDAEGRAFEGAFLADVLGDFTAQELTWGFGARCSLGRITELPREGSRARSLPWRRGLRRRALLFPEGQGGI